VKVQILELLKRLQAERGFAMLFVGHDIEAVRWISDEVAIMHRGRIVERSCPQELDSARVRDPYTQRLLAARLTVPVEHVDSSKAILPSTAVAGALHLQAV